MEAEVAIQHAPEKWVKGEPRFEQAEKVTLIYGSQQKAVEPRAVSRLHVKPSRSYDKELGTSVVRDTDARPRSKLGQVSDDLILSLGNRPEVFHQDLPGGRQMQPNMHLLSTHGVFEKSLMDTRWKESGSERRENYGHKKDRCRTKSGEASHRSRHKHAIDSQKAEAWVEELQNLKTVDLNSIKNRPITVEFHLKEDQLPMKCKRPANLSSPFSSSSYREKPSSLVILEVKDGPTFCCKPAVNMVSDSGIGDDTIIHSRQYTSRDPAEHSLPRIAEPSSFNPAHIYSSRAYPGGFSTSSTENPTFSAFNRDFPMGISRVGLVPLGAAFPLVDDSSKIKMMSSQLPRAHGLRKPDLSVLSTQLKSRTVTCPEDELHVSGSRDPQQHGARGKESSLLSTTLPVSSVPPIPCSKQSFSTTEQPLLSSPKLNVDLISSSLKHAPAFSENKPEETSQPSAIIRFDPSTGFQNTSEILQQKAGIKHDDIVVGPRRPLSGIHQSDMAGVPGNSVGSVSRLAPGPSASSLKPHDKTVLSLSSDTLSRGHPVLLLKDEGRNRRDIHSESDFTAIGDSTGGSHSKYGAAKNSASLEDTSRSGSRTYNANFLNNSTSRLVDDHSENASRLKIVDKKADHQRLQNRKHFPGQGSDIKRLRTTSENIPSEALVTYKTKSLDRNHKAGGETKPVPASGSRQQLHSPKSKSSVSTPTKKQPASSKLHMLSNIPVPICHDPPAKRHSYHRSPSTPDPAEMIVPLAYEKHSVSAAPDFLHDRHKITKLEQPASKDAPIIPVFNSASSEHAPDVGTALDVNAQSCHDTNVQPADSLKSVAAPRSSTSTPAAASELTKTCAGLANTISEHSPVLVPHAAAISDNQSAATAEFAVAETDQAKSQSLTNSPSHVPVKPRLHRSEEHLLTGAKLSVFNSAENVPHFDTPESSSNRALSESTKLEKAESDNISPLKKNHGLARIGVMRRGSDRSEMHRKMSDRPILPIDQNDPSVEDLKKATSLKELCQSMASLLNIDNVKAAEMITTSLSQRQDLVEGLDADAIMDYLSHHGVLDPGILVGLDDKASVTQRNSTLLRHVEEHGDTAVALFINALRQSGQLHLASSLDTEQRIKPVSGNGYFGKDRHKGELTIKIEVEALKIIAPREPRSEKIVDASLLGSPGRQGLDETGVVVKDAADEEDFVKPKSCWCFCFSYKSKLKSISKKDTMKQKKSDVQKQEQRSSSLENEMKPSEDGDKKHVNVKPQRAKSQEKTKKGKDSVTKSAVVESNKKDVSKTKDKANNKKPKASKSKSKVSGKAGKKTGDSTSGQLEHFKSVPDVYFQQGTDNKSAGDLAASKMTLGLRPYVTQQPYTMNTQPYNRVDGTPQGQKPDTESWDPIIMEYDPKLELIKLRAGQEELASPTRQSGNIGIMCEQWKSNGRHFQQKASQLCERIVQELHTDIIKYFEQDRGTLVLDVTSDTSSIQVINICMMQTQVRRLQQEIADDSLLNKMQDMFFSTVNISDFDIRGIKLRIVLDEQELNIVNSELS